MDADRQVIRRVLDGDVDAFELLLRRYAGRVLGYVAKRVPGNDADFVAQEVFIRAFRSLAGYRANRPFDHWLVRIACRCCCDYWRKRKSEMEKIVIEADESHHFSFDQALVGQSNDSYRQFNELQEMKEQMQAALNELELDDRTLVEDIYFNDLSHKEAAMRQGCTPASVRTRIHRIRRKLQRLMNPGGTERPRGETQTED